MVLDNIVMKIHEQYLTETNEQILLRHKKRTSEPVYIGVIQKNMDEVLFMINNVGNSGNKEQDVLEIATHILGVITLKQPSWMVIGELELSQQVNSCVIMDMILILIQKR